jgi:hypothetical protein
MDDAERLYSVVLALMYLISIDVVQGKLEAIVP